MNKLIVVLLLVCFSFVCSYTPAARAAVVSTATVLSQQAEQSLQKDLQATLAREDVRKELVDMGVDPEYADQRIGALTDYELSQIQQRIGDLPAGSSALAILGGLFLVLLVLELLGVTNVFTKL